MMSPDQKLEQLFNNFTERLMMSPGVTMETAEEVGELLSEAFPFILPWDDPAEKRLELQKRDAARKKLREMIQDEFGFIMP